MVEKLHKNKIVVAGIIGHPKHVKNVLKSGADMIIYQGGEGERRRRRWAVYTPLKTLLLSPLPYDLQAVATLGMYL